MSLKVSPESILNFLSNEHLNLALCVFDSVLLEKLQKSLECTLLEILLGLANLGKYRSISTISNFGVGAVAFCSSGNAYIGYNIELEKVILQQTIHAEQCAITNAWYHGEKQIDMIVTNVIPCGYCRQFMTELPNLKNLKILTLGHEIQLLTQLLPHNFGPENLGLDTEKENILLVDNSDCSIVESLNSSDSNYIKTIFEKGIKKSYSPSSYSGRCPSALGIKSHGSTDIIIGSYLESAAYNPSLSPLQTGICIWSLLGPRSAEFLSSPSSSSSSSSLLSAYTSHRLDFSLIEEVVLLEDPTANITQAPVLKQIVNILAPSAKFQTINIKVPRN